MDRSWVGKSNAPKHQDNEQHREQGSSCVNTRIAFQVHEVSSNAVAFDDAHANEDGPNGVQRDVDVRPGIFVKEEGCNLKKCEKHRQPHLRERQIKFIRFLVQIIYFQKLFFIVLFCKEV